MDWVTIFWSMSAAVTLTLGTIHFVVWLQDRRAWTNLLFFVSALAIAGIAVWEIALMHTDSIEGFATLIRWAHVLLFVLVTGIVGFIGMYFGTGRWWLGGAAVGVQLLSLIVNFSSYPNVNYREITMLKQMDFLGDSVWMVAQSVPNPWTRLGELSSLLLLVFAVDASLALWRKGDRKARRRAAVVGGSITLFIVVASGSASLIHAGVLRMPYLVSLPFLVIVISMGLEHCYDLLRVARNLDQGLVAAVAAAFVHVAPNRVAEEIEMWMQRMIASLDADRITLFEFTTDRAPMRVIHQVTRKGVPKLPPEFSYDRLSWYLGELRAGRPVVLSDLTKELPARASAEREFAREYGIQAVMAFPLLVSGAIVYAIGCVVIHKARVWSEAAQNTLRSVGQIFAHALAERDAEIALRESEQRFRIVADSAPVAIWMSGLDRLCTFFNKPWLEFTGRTIEQELGNGWAEGVHPDDLERCLKTYTEAFDAREPFVMEYRLRRHDGEYRWLRDDGVPRYDGENNFTGYIGSCVDITELISQQQALRESEERISLAVDAANLGLWEWNFSKDELWGTKTRRALLGLPTSGKLTLEDGLSRVHVDDRDRVRQIFNDAVETGKDFYCEYRLTLANGSTRWIENRGRCVSGTDSRDVILRCVSIDVTERRKAEEEFRLAVEASPSGIILVDERERIVLVNSQIEKQFGYGREELIGQSVEILVPERFANKHPEHRAKFPAAPTARAMGAGRELFARRKDDSEFPVEIGLSPIETSEGTIVLATVVDISARKQAEAEAVRHREELGHLSRVAVMGELAASIAHELNQPLSGIISNASAGQRFIDRGDVDLGQMRELLADIVADGRRAGDVIRGIRNMVKRGARVRQRVNLNNLVMNVVRMVNADAKLRSCEVEPLLEPNLPAIEADPIQLQQVLINLVTNAFDAMRNTSLGHRKVVIATGRNGESAIFASVRDYGIGIPEDAHERLFDHFFTTKAEGLGLGLGIVRSIIELHGGTVAAENVDGGGARFHFTLPVNVAGS